ncbi:hypothetical protein N6H05_10755 [Sphingobium sp. WTD-1]|uniref:hypothetical protein n=1 Tax=Sphingobium sp. WTD-1 TaxID=2979467 RepID=UPI0024DEB2C6|nr:hypothetical protein [Sphingobium sp. WTD-1]WIA58245.1 hypothetical protein N6H05_10755 [Sphingobium sp. WTD-1]
MIRAVICAAILAVSSGAIAQTDGALPASTLITVTPNEEITSKKVEVGTRVSFSVVNDIVENGVVAIPRGSQVAGTIAWKTGKAIGGKSGKFEVKFDSVNVRGRDYALRGVHRQEGKGNTAAALLGSILVSGRSAQMLPGQMANAFTAEPIPFAVARVVPAAPAPTPAGAQAVVQAAPAATPRPMVDKSLEINPR